MERCAKSATQGTIHVLRKRRTGWVGLENGNFAYSQYINHAYILTKWVGWSEKVPKPAYVIYKWSLKDSR